MFTVTSRSLSRMSSTQSVESPSSCLSSAFSSRQDVSRRSGKEWWLFAIAKALHQDNGVRKGSHKNAFTTSKTNSSIENKMAEYRQLYEELTKLKKILVIIKGEYEDSKGFEIFRRYARLKGMIRRTVMYTKLGVIPDVTNALGTNSLVLMTAPGVRKHLVNIPECPRADLPNRIHTLKKRISFVRGQIELLADSYEASKQFIVFQRYRLMKSMIKNLLTNCIDLQSNV